MLQRLTSEFISRRIKMTTITKTAAFRLAQIAVHYRDQDGNYRLGRFPITPDHRGVVTLSRVRSAERKLRVLRKEIA